MLGMIILIRLPLASAEGDSPTQWWYYVGGLLGGVLSVSHHYGQAFGRAVYRAVHDLWPIARIPDA